MTGPHVTLADLEALYRRRYSEFLRVATAICDDPSLGADAVQEAFVRAIRGRETFRGERRSKRGSGGSLSTPRVRREVWRAGPNRVLRSERAMGRLGTPRK
ncbi:RNA polymerase sigma factor [Gaiella sp.]|uniref:RNA polymerase sigma factor n=1 Tax=Gaiella sp. TaxID=2663207 RepID=UPI002E3782DE|nr:sigma factor [Gaiella sp.]HEX5583998.1 sigma factor [Gaiella sp.]